MKVNQAETTTMESPISAMLVAPDTLNKGSHHTFRPDWHKAEVQPPLPLDPPPPDDIIPNIRLKQEIVDTEYETPHLSPRPEPPIETTTVPTNEDTREICREFVRGTCKRGSICKYSHKLDLSQLEGVYTFCWRYQNSVCTLPNCRYVHATVFEERRFYRTGILPMHALNHDMSNSNKFQQEAPVLPFNVDFSIPPPPLPTDLGKPMMNCQMPSTSMDTRGYVGDMHHQMSTSTSPATKREWRNMETFAAPPCDVLYNEHLPKKCKHCDYTEFRLDCKKNRVKELLQAKKSRSKKMDHLVKQIEKLRNLTVELFRISSKPQTHINPGFSAGCSDKTLFDQINSFLGRLQ